ncbi:3-hydroxyacyl-CoA dehydrogenase NAD-binding domain-containing protein [Peribacillus simplex]|uniref:3-hydroxyacyl-CoA dehydrogenase NAD-binding domain-containing protein n=1 Tax=Peribacillus simplex TaxID=1478 RepID=UPI0021AA1D1A|nr:3-hydroxyacyl-CoA dehydrogenase NAD-binding domain-containing protein [Peribacillus simplex]
MTRLHTKGMTNKQIQSITVIGAGQMEHQIAMLAAFGGYETILQDVQENALNTAQEKLDH